MEFNGLLNALAKLFEKSLITRNIRKEDIKDDKSFDSLVKELEDEMRNTFNIFKIMDLEEDIKLLKEWKNRR